MKFGRSFPVDSRAGSSPGAPGACRRATMRMINRGSFATPGGPSCATPSARWISAAIRTSRCAARSRPAGRPAPGRRLPVSARLHRPRRAPLGSAVPDRAGQLTQARNVGGIQTGTVTSADGTVIVFDQSGAGPAVVLVQGADGPGRSRHVRRCGRPVPLVHARSRAEVGHDSGRPRARSGRPLMLLMRVCSWRTPVTVGTPYAAPVLPPIGHGCLLHAAVTT